MRPIVDLWAREMAKSFLKKFPTLVFKRNEYRALLTIDTDQPFAYQGKSLLRSIGGLLHDKTNAPVNVTERYRIMAKGERDPFDVFDYMIETIEKSILIQDSSFRSETVQNMTKTHRGKMMNTDT